MKKEIKSDITSLSEHDRKVLDKYSMSSYSLIEVKSETPNLLESEGHKDSN